MSYEIAFYLLFIKCVITATDFLAYRLMINAQIKHKHLCVFETFIIPTTVEKTNKQTKTPDEDKNTRS